MHHTPHAWHASCMRAQSECISMATNPIIAIRISFEIWILERTQKRFLVSLCYGMQGLCQWSGLTFNLVLAILIPSVLLVNYHIISDACFTFQNWPIWVSFENFSSGRTWTCSMAPAFCLAWHVLKFSVAVHGWERSRLSSMLLAKSRPGPLRWAPWPTLVARQGSGKWGGLGRWPYGMVGVAIWDGGMTTWDSAHWEPLSYIPVKFQMGHPG